MSAAEVQEARKEELVRASIEAAGKSYSPYSGYPVGAALLLPDGRVVRGCNVENCAYPLGCCAEKTAVVKAVSEGHRSFLALAVSAPCSQSDLLEYPKMCGACRQVLCEFCDDQLPVYLVRQCDSAYKCVTLGACIPGAFRPTDLGQS